MNDKLNHNVYELEKGKSLQVQIQQHLVFLDFTINIALIFILFEGHQVTDVKMIFK